MRPATASSTAVPSATATTAAARPKSAASHPHEEQDNDSWKLVLFTDVKVRAHTFAFISPAMTDKYKIPNPCTCCHTDKSTAWATEALRHWPERSPWRLD